MKTIFLDTETTGLNNGVKLDTAISIGVCTSDGVPLLDVRIKPLVEVDTQVYELTGLTPELLETAYNFRDVSVELTDILMSADKVVMYNAPFDVRILLNTFWHSGLVMPNFQWFCAMTEYAELFGIPDEKRGFKSQRLTSALEQQGLPILDAHNALSDAQMTASLWNCMHDLEYTIKTGKRFKSHKDEFNGDVVSIQRRKGAKGDYLVLNTHGASINLFDNQFSRFEAVGHPVGVWFAKLATRLDETQPLSKPIPISYKFNDKGFTDVTAVKEAK